MKTGEKIFVRTNYGLLNKIVGTNYKGYMKGYYTISDNCYIWMISLDGNERDGWINNINSDGTITEKYIFNINDTPTLPIGINYKNRLVFDKIKIDGKTQYFIFRGVYKLAEGSSYTHRILRKISDETDLV